MLLGKLVQCDDHVEHLLNAAAQLIEMLEDLLIFGYENPVRLFQWKPRLIRISNVGRSMKE